jgi:hypothetical protein
MAIMISLTNSDQVRPKKKYAGLWPLLDERSRWLMAASEVRSLAMVEFH